MIKYNEIPKNIDDKQRHNIEELNRVKEGLKNLVASMINNGNDAEDIAEVCWHCGFEYATSYYLEEGMLNPPKKYNNVMTKEEIQKYADELGQQYFPNEHNIWARENIEAQFVSEACMRMAEYVEQELIKKACEWMKANIKSDTISYADIWDQSDIDLLVIDFTTIDEMIENFEKTIGE